MATATVGFRYPLAADRADVEAAARRSDDGHVLVLHEGVDRWGRPPRLSWAPALEGRLLARLGARALVEYSAKEVLAGP